MRRGRRTRCARLLACVLSLGLGACGDGGERGRFVSAVPDLSGLAWVEGDTFLAVHDAKVPEEATLPRVSLLTLPRAGRPLLWQPLAVDWSASGGPSHDLESVARIPGTALYLLAESGDGGSAHQRLFLAELHGDTLGVRRSARWPRPIYDVEGTAIARLGDGLYVLYAERADGAPATEIVWARLTLDPLALHDSRSVAFANPAPVGPGSRPVSALEVDGEGVLFAASAFDPDRDEGPFRSAVWRIGRLAPAAGGHAALVLDTAATGLARLDGLKVESLALRTTEAGGSELVVGTDDELFGGAIRRLPVRRPPDRP